MLEGITQQVSPTTHQVSRKTDSNRIRHQAMVIRLPRRRRMTLTGDEIVGAVMERLDVLFQAEETYCAAWLYLPGNDGGRLPCVVMGHGCSLTRHDGIAAYAEMLADTGVAVLLYDHRFFGDSFGHPRQLVSTAAQIADRRAAVAYARRFSAIDPTGIVLWGYSFSCGSAISVAASDHDIAGMILLSPFIDGPARLKTAVRKSPRTVAWLIGRMLTDSVRSKTMPITATFPHPALMNLPGEAEGFASLVTPGSPWRNEVHAAKFCATLPLYRLVRLGDKVRCPTLIQHGKGDTTAPLDAARRLAERTEGAHLKIYDLDHWEAFSSHNVAVLAGDQASWLREVIESPTLP
jgi:pimeloyl-ACP methyl ester carboxylesterase